jgi:hypothetical protein
MDDDRLKRAGGGNYFDELLARIRDIRSAEKVFWRKVLDIYATSIDYDPGTDASQRFFATVQNKMLWAAHGQTAAEIVYRRADAAKENMGLIHWIGEKPSKSEAVIAKNYLAPDELDTLNRIVNAYLEFAELQALNRKPMYMQDWIARHDDFLRLSGRELLTHAGTISHEQAIERAQVEDEKHREIRINQPSPIERHFEQAVKKLSKSEKFSREATKGKKKHEQPVFVMQTTSGCPRRGNPLWLPCSNHLWLVECFQTELGKQTDVLVLMSVRCAQARKIGQASATVPLRG